VHTPTHALVGLALFDRRGPSRFRPALLGAVLPDAPALLFYLYYKVVLMLPEAAIWGAVYQRAAWQAVLAPFHSIPIAVALLAVFAWRKLRAGVVFATSLLLHDGMDLPVHREDAHRHLWPLSDVRFVSPISYWDRAHHAALVAPVEVALVVGGAALLWRRYPSVRARAALTATAIGMIGAWAAGRLFWSS
jgi:hypothetical protein